MVKRKVQSRFLCFRNTLSAGKKRHESWWVVHWWAFRNFLAESSLYTHCAIWNTLFGMFQSDWTRVTCAKQSTNTNRCREIPTHEKQQQKQHAHIKFTPCAKAHTQHSPLNSFSLSLCFSILCVYDHVLHALPALTHHHTHIYKIIFFLSNKLYRQIYNLYLHPFNEEFHHITSSFWSKKQLGQLCRWCRRLHFYTYIYIYI